MLYLTERKSLRVLHIDWNASGYGLYFDMDNESWLIARADEILIEVSKNWTVIDILVEDEVTEIYFRLIDKIAKQRAFQRLKERFPEQFCSV